jgi:hypothetical protein
VLTGPVRVSEISGAASVAVGTVGDMQVMSGSEGWAVLCGAVNGILMILNQRQLHGAHTAWAVQRKQKRLRRMSVAGTGVPQNVSVAAKDEANRALDDSNRGALVIAPRVKVLALPAVARGAIQELQLHLLPPTGFWQSREDVVMLLRRKNLTIILETNLHLMIHIILESANHSFDTKNVLHRLPDYTLEIPLHRMQHRR